MIISTGVDLAEVERIQAAIEHPRIGPRFRDRVFTERKLPIAKRSSAASTRATPGGSRPRRR